MQWFEPRVSPNSHALEANLPRATLILAAAESGLSADLWLGGAESAAGEPLEPSGMGGAWILDCAGELPRSLRQHAGLWLPCVFADLESTPDCRERLFAIARGVGAVLRGVEVEGTPLWPAATPPPQRIYCMCQQGLNRSALLAGLVLRAAGHDAQQALATLRQRRPGALANRTFAELVEAGPYDGDRNR